jgi:replication initiation and membrane attachment protein DnaB
MDYNKFIEGSGRWFKIEDYPTMHHCKTPSNGALWFWLWFYSFEHGIDEGTEFEFYEHQAMRMSSINTLKEYRRALRDLEALGLIRVIKISRANAMIHIDIIKIVKP